MQSLSAIEQGIKDAIAALGRDYIAEIATYGGEFDDGLEDVVRRFPAVWTTFQGSGKPEQLSARKWRVPLVFVVLVGARSIRSEESQRDGTEVEVGSFQLLHDVQFALLNNDLKAVGVEGIKPLEIGKIDTVFNAKTRGDALSILSQEWHTSYVVTAPDREADCAAWMERITLNYFPRQSDSMPTASDQINLTTD
jgi:phage gp37-like protein